MRALRSGNRSEMRRRASRAEARGRPRYGAPGRCGGSGGWRQRSVQADGGRTWLPVMPSHVDAEEPRRCEGRPRRPSKRHEQGESCTGVQRGRQSDMPAADEGPGPAALPEPCYRRSMTAGRSGRGRDRRGRPPSNLRSAGAERSRRSHERRQIAHVLPASRPSRPPPWKPCIHGHANVDHNWHCAACWSQPRQCTRLQPISRRKRTKG